jgi:hypothetical protein
MERAGGVFSDHEAGGNDFENMMNRKRQENKRYRYSQGESRLEIQRPSDLLLISGVVSGVAGFL